VIRKVFECKNGCVAADADISGLFICSLWVFNIYGLHRHNWNTDHAVLRVVKNTDFLEFVCLVHTAARPNMRFLLRFPRFIVVSLMHVSKFLLFQKGCHIMMAVHSNRKLRLIRFGPIAYNPHV
jgi:hypothetical protein